MAGGRPTDYTEEIAEMVCTWLSGGKSLRAFCRQEDTPDVTTVCRWIVKHDGFRQQYAQAREAAGYAHGDGVIEIVELLRDGGLEPQVAKAMMDGLKWAAERMAPKAHSQRQEVDHTTNGKDMMPAVTVSFNDSAPD
tara:strand:- start:112 stop:522 length:411 start_codon:yes stop_codon:yes gene_type:complete